MEQAANPLMGDPMVESLPEPLFIRDANILSPGVWTGEDNRPTMYTSEEIENGFLNTDWSNMNLFLDHKDSKKTAVAYWIGFIKNARMVNGSLMGDVEIWHPLFARFIKQAKAKFAVSATMIGKETMGLPGEPSNYHIDHFQSVSLVDNPGCAGSWLPKMLAKGRSEGSKTITAGSIEEQVDSKEDLKEKEDKKELEEDQKENAVHPEKKELAKVTNMEEVRKEKGMSVADFYAVPRDPPSSSSLPIFDAAHVRNALARFEQTSFNNPSQKKSAMNKIVRAADKFGIKISEHASKKELESCKEVKKMTEEKTNESIEEKEEVTEVTKEVADEEVKVEESKVEEVATEVAEKSETAEVAESTEEVKALSAKLDTLADSVSKLTSLVQKSLSAGENSENESKEVKVEEDSEDTEEQSDVEKELEDTKKELAATKAELNSPDPKTLSLGSESANLSVDDANLGMLNALRAQGNIQ